MAKKITALDPAVALTGGDLFEVVQEISDGGGIFHRENRKLTLADLIAALGAAPVVTITTAAHNLLATDVGAYNRTTYAGDATVTVQNEASEPIEIGSEVHFRAVGGTLTVNGGVGVVLNEPAGGTRVVPQGGAITLKKVAADEWDILGQVEAAP